MTKIRAMYSPTTGTIGCVIIQVAMGGDRTIAQLFDTADWEVAPIPSLAPMDATREEWQWLARLSRQERVDRWKAMP